ncbi:MAG: tetratricopeptide repeat protein [Elusimicrobia bacterium]|nr:tetratricopeptide repeat protein [Elusimicrobiota bacterium]
MRCNVLSLLIVALLATSSLAQDEIPPTGQRIAQAVEQETKRPASQLIRLDQSLTQTQEDRKQDRIDEKRYQEFLTKFRTDLDAAMAGVKPTPANTVLHARILSRLGDTEQALAALGPTLAHDLANPAVRVALGQVRYDQKDYPAALAEANAILARDPENKDALALKHSSGGRIGPGAAAPSAGVQGIGTAAVAEQFRAPRAKDSPKVQALVPRIREARDSGDLRTAMTLAQELMRVEPSSEYAQEIYRIVTKDYARWQRVQKTVGYINSAKTALSAGRGDEALDWAQKAVQTDPAPEVMKFAEEVRQIVDDGKVEAVPQKRKEPEPGSGGIPLWPMFPVFGLGAASYAVAKSRKTVESEDGFNEDDRPQPGELQRFVVGSILAGLAGAGLYLGGAMVVSAGAPLAARFMSGPGQQAMRLARSEAGAINPRSIQGVEGAALQEKVAAEEAAEIVRQVVIKKGEILNRVWHSEWTKGSKLSGPEGYSYCRGACLPINASSAIEGRGLNVGVINNARSGALYRVTDDVVVTIRRSIGGYNEEILLRGPEDVKKLQLISASVSSIPP